MSTAGLLLLYNVLAFGGQLPAGILLDRLGRPGLAAGLSLVLTALGLLLLPLGALPAIVLAGVGSAIFHVAGGSIALSGQADKAGGVGVFAAPGVTGLALGGWMAWQGMAVAPYLGIGLVVLAVLASQIKGESISKATEEGIEVDRHDVWMMLLLLAIALRSAVWNLVEVLQQGETTLLIAAAVAASVGKVMGGFLADRLGWRQYVVLALVVATPLLVWGEGRDWLFLPGIALLQSATPAALAMLRNHLPQAPATAAGLGFGLAIALGGIPFILGFPPGEWLLWTGPPLAALAFWRTLRSKKVAGQT